MSRALLLQRKDENLAKIRELLNAGANPNVDLSPAARDVWPDTENLLHTAILAESPETVEALLKAGADWRPVPLEDLLPYLQHWRKGLADRSATTKPQTLRRKLCAELRNVPPVDLFVLAYAIDQGVDLDELSEMTHAELCRYVAHEVHNNVS